MVKAAGLNGLCEVEKLISSINGLLFFNIT